jgi:hypothetical protein
MISEPVNAELSKDPRIGACVYLLHGLLRRLEQQRPGLIADMTEGVANDRAAMNPEASASAGHGCEIADEALRVLRLMSEQLSYLSVVFTMRE